MRPDRVNRRSDRRESPYKSRKRGNKKVVVGNLSWDCTWQHLKDYFRLFGTITRADVMTNQEGKSKGTGIVEFASYEDAEEAIRSLHNTEFG